ncbi:hypothetical protein Thivi_4396 [Thiocystis violascens DSM 198]|uniref:Uncharacterized protein n=2 Tax=Thiocystis violascens TaxID=73141 RepID=I3YGT1_THIV6|nr:hypothetical protein Thivi_4396 [Thiocystis violascens DSM 198]
MSKRGFERKTRAAPGERRPVAGQPYRQTPEQQARDWEPRDPVGYTPRALDLKVLAASPTDRHPTRPAVNLDPLDARRARVRGQRQGRATQAATAAVAPRPRQPARAPRTPNVTKRLLAVLQSDPARAWSVFELRAQVAFSPSSTVSSLLRRYVRDGRVASIPSERGPHGFGGKRYRWTGEGA